MKMHAAITLLCAGSLAVSCSAPQAPPPSATNAQPAPASASAAPAKPKASPKASDESVTIAFNNDSAALSSDARGRLDGAARLYRQAGPEVMIVSGHTDKTGDEYKNILLSARRAETVKHALVDRGVPADKLQIVAVGEAEPVPGIPPDRAAVITWR